MVPDPLVVRDDPVPRIIAAVVLVAPVMLANEIESAVIPVMPEATPVAEIDHWSSVSEMLPAIVTVSSVAPDCPIKMVSADASFMVTSPVEVRLTKLAAPDQLSAAVVSMATSLALTVMPVPAPTASVGVEPSPVASPVSPAPAVNEVT